MTSGLRLSQLQSELLSHFCLLRFGNGKKKQQPNKKRGKTAEQRRTPQRPGGAAPQRGAGQPRRPQLTPGCGARLRGPARGSVPRASRPSLSGRLKPPSPTVKTVNGPPRSGRDARLTSPGGLGLSSREPAPQRRPRFRQAGPGIG